MKTTRNRVFVTVALVVLPAFALLGQRKETVAAIEVVGIRNNGVDLKLRSVWEYPVSIAVCDDPERLSDLGYDLESREGKKRWVRLRLRSPFGDRAPTYLEIGGGRTDFLPANFSPAFLGIKRGMRLRIVVHAWRAQSIGLGASFGVPNQTSMLLQSRPLVWTEQQ